MTFTAFNKTYARKYKLRRRKNKKKEWKKDDKRIIMIQRNSREKK